jgi:hypothetical protein
MIQLSWKTKVALVLLGSSAVLLLIHFILFADLHNLLFYLALDVVFVPIQVLLVTVLIERLMNEREKRLVLRKLNMIIGAFFGELGSKLITMIGATCVDFSTVEKSIQVAQDWRKSHYEAAAEFIQSYQCKFDPDNVQLQELKKLLLAKRDFVLGLLQNPNLFEHDRFTDLLWAVCHLTEELEARKTLQDLPRSDLKHLESDIQRAFSLLVREWLSYMQHLRRHYPYIYSLSVRTNPFNPAASPVVLGN